MIRWNRRRSGANRWNRRRSGANGSRGRALTAVITSGLVIGTTGAAISTADSPPDGSVHFQQLRAKCAYKPVTGNWVARYSGKFTVQNANALDQLDEVYYLKPKISIQKRGAGGWRAIESRDNESTRFTSDDLRYWIERAVKTQVGPTIAYGGQLRGFLKVKMMLVREGRFPDRKVWVKEYQGQPFTCEFPG